MATAIKAALAKKKRSSPQIYKPFVTKRDLKPHTLLTFCHLASYNKAMVDSRNDFGRTVKQQRVALELTLHELATVSGVSSSHLGRIERGDRFPSAHILRRIAKPLGFEEGELFALAGYLSPTSPGIAEAEPQYTTSRLDPYVANVLAQEPFEVQRSVIGILTILKSLTKSMVKETI